MNKLKKVILWFMGIIICCSIIFIGFGYYLQEFAPKCEPFQTKFLGKDVKFPMTFEEATKKYNLINDGVRWRSSSVDDTLLIADPKYSSYSPPELHGLIFLLKKPIEIDSLQAVLEIKYGKKFEPQILDYSFRHMKINDCTYLIVEYRGGILGTKNNAFDKTRITCRVGFYYNISETGLINTWADD